ncbi:MAG: OmpH family outer membrane protein [Planctomycetaceae bacterium]|nr:OmpH family outer membrane protein [Planctomycetaceae bacterium]
MREIVSVACVLAVTFTASITAADRPVSALTAIAEARRFSHPARIALIDMGAVFKQSLEFNRRREALKEEIAASERIPKRMAEELQGHKAAMELLNKNSQEYLDAERRVARLTLDFETFRQQALRDFQLKEARIYRSVYEQIAREVADFARSREIDLVMRYSMDPLDDSDPKTLIEAMNRQVIYANGLDITADIIEAINSESQK